MIKSRCSYLCNLKLVLIVLVVLGHSLEQAGAQESALYRLIYLFHMPLFAFVTGLHLKTVKSCLKQARAAALLYLGIQGGIVLAEGLAGIVHRVLTATSLIRTSSMLSKEALPVKELIAQVPSGIGEALAGLATPFWHLWYLLSMCVWALLAALCCRRPERRVLSGAPLFAAAVAAALFCGVLPFGRFLSVSRTVCFFPYVVLGILCPVGLQEGPKIGTRCLLAAAGGLGSFLTWSVLQYAPYDFFYRADSYGEFGMSAGEGCTLRGFSLAGALSLGMLALALVPAVRLPMTKAGGDTLPIYILHVIFVPLAELFDPGNGYRGIRLTVFSVLVVLFLWELGRWSRPMYTVSGKNHSFPRLFEKG